MRPVGLKARTWIGPGGLAIQGVLVERARSDSAKFTDEIAVFGSLEWERRDLGMLQSYVHSPGIRGPDSETSQTVDVNRAQEVFAIGSRTRRWCGRGRLDTHFPGLRHHESFLWQRVSPRRDWRRVTAGHRLPFRRRASHP